MRNKLILAVAIVTAITAGILAESKWVPGSGGGKTGPALIGGNENGGNLLLCAAFKEGTYHPGKIVGNNCNFGYGGKEITEPNYFTLQVTNDSIKRYSWYKAANGAIPKVAGSVPIEVGKEGSRTLYVCRAAYKGGVHPGKIVGNNCNFGWGGNEITIPNYEVLMFKTN